MNERELPETWWQGITRRERFDRAEWLMLGVSALALAGAAVMLARVMP